MLGSRTRPNVFVVGDAKCGASSLYDLFALTPGIGTTRRKEHHFFSAPEILRRVAGPGDARIPCDIVGDEARYLAEVAAVGNAPVVVDVSPSYLQNPPAAARIKAFAPDARIVIALREPARQDLLAVRASLGPRGARRCRSRRPSPPARRGAPLLLHHVRLRGGGPLRRGGGPPPSGGSGCTWCRSSSSSAAPTPRSPA
jgi:hypothetical protein